MAITRPLFAGDDPTPASVKRRQLLAEQLLADNSGVQQISHPLQAVAQVLGAGVGSHLQRRADRDEATGLQSRRDGMMRIADQAFGGGAPSFGGTSTPSSSTSRAPSTPSRTASLPSGERASYIRQGLITRGLPEHVADGFLANFQDESGLDPGINERNPIVPGSRGGFGLYQLTGPRRREYEAFAGRRGVDPSDIDAQLDFLVGELQGSERRAGERILGSRHTASAAQAIVNDFLRPSPEHRQSRSARYARLGGGVQVASLDPREAMASALGAGPVQQTGANSALVSALTGGGSSQPQMSPQIAPASPAPSSGQQDPMVAQLLGDQQAQPAQGVNRALIAELLGNPWTEDMGQQLLMQQIETQQRNSDPLRQIELQRAQLELDALRNPRQEPIEVGGVLLDPQTMQPIFDSRSPSTATVGNSIIDTRTGQPIYQGEAPKPTSVQEFEYGQETPGYFEQQERQRRAGATNVNLPGQPNIGTIPQGYAARQDDAGNWSMAPIPGGPEDTSSANIAAAGNRDISTNIITNAASIARNATRGGSLPVTGTLGRAAGMFPETNAAEVRRQVGTLQANAKIENLQAMREASPTGGALGAVSDSENAMLAAKSGALDPDSPNFLRDLDDYERTLLQIVHGPEAGDAIFVATRTPPPDDGAANDPAIAGSGSSSRRTFPMVRSDEEFDALPPGAQFYDPQGNLRTKPNG